MNKGEQLSVCIKIAVDAHYGQMDRSKKPYILHPLHILSELFGECEEVQCIGVLHDTIEDNKEITYEFLRSMGVTERVISGVRCLTKVPGETEEEYQLKVLSNPDAVIVKKEDLKHNSDLTRLKGVTDKDIARTIKYIKFYHRLCEHQKSQNQEHCY